MATRLPLLTIESILRDHLYPYRCDCHEQEGSHVSVRLYRERQDDELTVFGITNEQCRDAANLVRLAQELRFELHATSDGSKTSAELRGR